MLSQPLLRTTNARPGLSSVSRDLVPEFPRRYGRCTRLRRCFAHCCGSHRSQINRASRRLQDHERVEGCDAVVATDIGGGERRGVARAAAGCELERDRGVCGGEDAVRVEVAAQWFISHSNRLCRAAHSVIRHNKRNQKGKPLPTQSLYLPSQSQHKVCDYKQPRDCKHSLEAWNLTPGCGIFSIRWSPYSW